MKKISAVLMTILLISSLLVGCVRQEAPVATPVETPTATPVATPVETPTATPVDTLDWPTRPIQIIVPFGAGGDTDFHARTYAKYLEPILGVPVVVVNVPGANGSVGSIQVRDAQPDGYTALFFHDSMLINNVVEVTDFAHEAFEVVAAGVVDNSYIMAVNAKSQFQTFDDVIEYAKANPGQLIYASAVGGYTFYFGRKIEEYAGVDFNIVDAGGGTDRNAALLAEKIDVNLNPYGVMKPFIDSGEFRVLAVFSEERSSLFPDVPTARELGYDLIAQRIYFLSFPKDTDPRIVAKVNEAMERVSAMPEYANDIANAYGLEPAFMNTSDTKAYLDRVMKEYQDAKSMIMGE
jgi:tripartite-type tricarboxylate transporter receptor subunit TctC